MAHALLLDEDHVVKLGRLLLDNFYSHIVVGLSLGTFWPESLNNLFRVGIHIRMGDMFIKDASIKTDARVHDIDKLKRAIELLKDRIQILAGNKSIVIFICADTTEARILMRDLLAPLQIIEPVSDPIHIGYEKSYETNSRDAETLSVAKEHFTLSTASAVFMASNSGFSKTACAIAKSICFARKAEDWVAINPSIGVYE